MNNKSTPKSCGCYSCKRGKSSKAGKSTLKASERSYRHFTKISLRKGSEVISTSPYAGYTD